MTVLLQHDRYTHNKNLYGSVERYFLHIFIQTLILCMFQIQLFGLPTPHETKSRTVVFAAAKKPTIIKNVQKSNHQKMSSIVQNGEEYVLVPKKLIGDKLTRYFAETSASVVAMSCCPQIQVHRRCLRDMFHAHEHKCSDQCPGCYQKVDRHIFAQSRPNYVVAHQRKQSCDFCYKSLKK